MIKCANGMPVDVSLPSGMDWQLHKERDFITPSVWRETKSKVGRRGPGSS